MRRDVIHRVRVNASRSGYANLFFVRRTAWVKQMGVFNETKDRTRVSTPEDAPKYTDLRPESPLSCHPRRVAVETIITIVNSGNGQYNVRILSLPAALVALRKFIHALTYCLFFFLLSLAFDSDDVTIVSSIGNVVNGNDNN